MTGSGGRGGKRKERIWKFMLELCMRRKWNVHMMLTVCTSTFSGICLFHLKEIKKLILSGGNTKQRHFFINRSRIRGILVNFGKLLRTAFCRHLSVASFFSKFPVIILVIQRFIQKYPFADVLQHRYSIFTGKNLYWNVLLKRNRCFPWILRNF